MKSMCHEFTGAVSHSCICSSVLGLAAVKYSHVASMKSTTQVFLLPLVLSSPLALALVGMVYSALHCTVLLYSHCHCPLASFAMLNLHFLASIWTALQ